MFHHLCIQTNDYKASLEFYIDILGFSLIKETSPFNLREFNTWIKKDNFLIELQTLKEGEVSISYNNNSLGISHFCIYDLNLDLLLDSIKSKGFKNFKLKNNEIIYTVENGRLFKIVAPEGTIIEYRDSITL